MALQFIHVEEGAQSREEVFPKRRAGSREGRQVKQGGAGGVKHEHEERADEEEVGFAHGVLLGLMN